MPDPSASDLLVRWQFDPTAALAAALAAVLYAGGVHRLAVRGRRWSPSRTAAAAGSLTAALLATQSGVGRFEGTTLWVHMVQHVLLGMVVPLLAVLAAPLTLTIQASRPATQQTLLRWLHGRSARGLTHPITAWCVFGGGLVVLYLTPLLDLAARNGAVHLLVHVHIVTAGLLFLAVVVGVDPMPGRPAHGVRLLALLAAIPFHAFVGLALLSAGSPVAPEAYPSLDDQREAAGLLWGAGEIFTLVVAAIVMRQWWVGEQRAMAREARQFSSGRTTDSASSAR